MSGKYYEENGKLVFEDETRKENMLGSSEVTPAKFNQLKSEVEKKTNDVHLFCDGGDIYMFEGDTHLTFNEIKALIENETNNVYITNGYYSLHDKYIYKPEITSEDKQAIGFIGSTQLDGEVYSWRIVINEDNEVKEDEIRLAKDDKIVVESKSVLGNGYDFITFNRKQGYSLVSAVVTNYPDNVAICIGVAKTSDTTDTAFFRSVVNVGVGVRLKLMYVRD